MGLLSFFVGKTPEELEQKGDNFFDKKEYGLSKIEYEKAWEKFKKKYSETSVHVKRVGQKVAKSKESLAFQHMENARELIENNCHEDAKELLELARELIEDAALLADIEKLLNELHPQKIPQQPAEEGFHDIPVPIEDDSETYIDDDEYFRALISPLSEEEQASYCGYGERFRNGFIALNQGEFHDAVTQLSIALNENSANSGYIPIELSTAYLNTAQFEPAIELLDAYIEKYPHQFRAYQLLCDIYWETNMFDQAHNLLDNCPEELRDDVVIHILKGETLFRQKEYQQAESIYSAYFKSHEWNESVALSLAKTYEAMGLNEKARDLYGKMINNCRGCGRTVDPYIKQRYADTCIETQQFSDVVLEFYLSLVHEDPNNRLQYFEKISRVYSARGNDAEARRYLDYAAQG